MNKRSLEIQKEKDMVPVKCLSDSQMRYIFKNYSKQTSKEMAEVLQIDRIKVTLFCQANSIEPVCLKDNSSKRVPKVVPPGNIVNINRLATARVRLKRYF